LCFFKFLSWAIALGSGTSGGTLAPLLTIGGAAGVIIATVILQWFPNAGIVLPMAALIGMSAMFAGASRAYLTSIVFALEATMQSHALLPLLGACTAAYMISFFLMENTIMTEKIARRGVFTPDSFEPDVLLRMTVAEIVSDEVTVINNERTVREIKEWLVKNHTDQHYFIAVDNKEAYCGTLRLIDVYQSDIDPDSSLEQFISKEKNLFVKSNDSLRHAVETMSKTGVDVLPILSLDADRKVTGVLSYKDIIRAYQFHMENSTRTHVKISLKRQRMKMLIRGRKPTNIGED
ncbi:MAG: chloride channel protein, partial [Mucilaginibacter sp.]